MTQQSQYMLMFSLGPVQTFIAQARKTRDLWLGSLLLSKLMEAAMEGIQGDFIFPATPRVHDTPDIPNKYVALFDDLGKAKAAAAQSERQIRERWETICTAIWNAILTNCDADERIWNRQTSFDTLFETFWVVVQGTPTEYETWLDETQRVFDARKRLRDFAAQEEPGEKSAISGDREVLHGKEKDSESIKAFWKKVATKSGRSQNDIDQEGNEHLDSIDLIKRFAMEADEIIPPKPFPSTSSIAAASFVEGLLTQSIELATLEQWYDATEYKEFTVMRPEAIPYLNLKASNTMRWILQRDGDVYFPETFTEYRLQKDYHITDGTRRRNIAKEGSQALQALLRAADAQHITRPTPYYSIIQMDGDNIGILLSGVAGRDEHRHISQALSDFSRKNALDLVEKRYPGRLVYAGGDDVLAFAPLARDVLNDQRASNSLPHILEVVQQLQLQYCERVKQDLPQERKSGVTASTGIAIAHHYTSLSHALRTAHVAESLAKKHYGRNALVVTVIRRSGEQTQVGCHWRYEGLQDSEGQPIEPIALFSRFYELFKYDMLSPKCIYILLEEAPALVKLEPKAQQSEVKRVLLRPSNDGKQNVPQKKEIERLSERLVKLAGAMEAAEYPYRKRGEPNSIELHSAERRYGLVEVLGWLLVMAFLARKDQE